MFPLLENYSVEDGLFHQPESQKEETRSQVPQRCAIDLCCELLQPLRFGGCLLLQRNRDYLKWNKLLKLPLWGLKVKVKVTQSCPTLCNPLDLYSPWNSPGQNTGLPHCRWILYQLSHKGSPWGLKRYIQMRWTSPFWPFWTIHELQGLIYISHQVWYC